MAPTTPLETRDTVIRAFMGGALLVVDAEYQTSFTRRAVGQIASVDSIDNRLQRSALRGKTPKTGQIASLGFIILSAPERESLPRALDSFKGKAPRMAARNAAG